MPDEDMVSLPRKSLQRIHDRNKELDARNQILEKEIYEMKNALPDNERMPEASCAHLRVRYRTVEQGSGCVSGHWQCDDCFTEFSPTRPTVIPADGDAERAKEAQEAIDNIPEHMNDAHAAGCWAYTYQELIFDLLKQALQTRTTPVPDDVAEISEDDLSVIIAEEISRNTIPVDYTEIGNAPAKAIAKYYPNGLKIIAEVEQVTVPSRAASTPPVPVDTIKILINALNKINKREMGHAGNIAGAALKEYNDEK